MATKIIDSTSNLPFSWWLTKNGTDIKPANTGRLGAFPLGTVILINLSVIEDHQCFTIDPRDPSKHIAKKLVGEGVYQKKVTIIEGEGQGLAPRWPNNIVGLDVVDRHFTMGICQQNGIFYFIIEEYIKTDEEYAPGQVKWYSSLRGFGAVASDNSLLDYKIHWTACPKRDNGLRYLDSGDKIAWKPEDSAVGDGTSSFIKEIKKAELVS